MTHIVKVIEERSYYVDVEMQFDNGSTMKVVMSKTAFKLQKLKEELFDDFDVPSSLLQDLDNVIGEMVSEAVAEVQ